MCLKRKKKIRDSKTDDITSDNTTQIPKPQAATDWRKKLLISVIVSVIISIIIIITVQVVFLHMWYSKGMENFDSASEASMISTGLSIIGIAISIWAGLNIINAIDCNELNSFIEINEKKVASLHDEIKENDNNLHDELKKEAEIIKDDLKKTESSFITSMNENFKNAFIKELHKVQNDYITIWLHKGFLDKCDIDTFDNWEDLLEIEQLFNQVYDLHESKYRKNWELISKAETGIHLSNNLLLDLTKVQDGDSLHNLIIKYLNCRIAEFHFYKGYCSNDEKKYNDFSIAAELYIRHFEGIIPNYGDVSFRPETSDLKLSCYICNTIGESYSKIIQEPNVAREWCIEGITISDSLLMQIADKAVFYCERPIEYLKGDKIDEMYYRDYGCALERQDRVHKRDKQKNETIISAYKNAFISASDENISLPNKRWYYVYYVYASYLHRIFDEFFKITTSEEYDSDLVLKINDFARDNTMLIEEMVQITEMALQSYPNAKAYISLRGFASCYKIYCLLAKDNLLDQEKEEIYENHLIVSKQIQKLDFMRIYDTYSKELRSRKLILDEIIKSKEL